ncbi:hypothetical protein K7432_003133 [Basidiobolus ranarum]|uniref:Protein kinase domain-containing protein n=1 Tax=Basidiobolus ranarum TaxID=34480 RepID=A0ABR2X0C9_9FUNG
MTELQKKCDTTLVEEIPGPVMNKAHWDKRNNNSSGSVSRLPSALGLAITPAVSVSPETTGPLENLPSTSHLTCLTSLPKGMEHTLLTPICTPVTVSVLFTVGAYNVLRPLGSGSFSKVFLAEDTRKYGGLVALKMVELNCDQSIKNLISREIQTLKALEHPNVVAFLESFETETHFVLVLEFVQDGDLFDYVVNNPNEFCESKIKKIFRQLVEAVEYLHSKRICHRDLKLENVLIQESSDGNISVKITDLGLAEFVSDNSILTTRCGSEEYTAPEVILGQPSNGFKADVWSLGVILYTMLVGFLPFSMDGSQSRRSFFYRIANADYRLPQDRPISQEAKDLLRSILQSNPKKRLDVETIKKHPWLNSM